MTISREQRFNDSRPCPACGRGKGNSWCYILDDGKSFWCGQSDNYGGRAGRRHPNPVKGGWFHDFDAASEAMETTSWRPSPRKTPRPAAIVQDFAAADKKFRLAVTPAMARLLASQLGLNVTSLRRMGLGWATAMQLSLMHTKVRGGARGCWTFTMYDGQRRVIGLRTRTEDGAGKFAVVGSVPGLFITDDIRTAPCGQIFLPEGPTSTAALHVLGLTAVGRPNNNQGTEHLRILLREMRPTRVLIVGDNDERWNDIRGRFEWPGLEGAKAIAAGICSIVRDVRVLLPPEGIKDARDWLKAGANTADVIRFANAARSAQEVLQHAG